MIAKAFSVGKFSATQTAAGVILPRMLVPYRLRSVCVYNPNSGFTTFTTLSIKDGQGGLIFAAGCGGTGPQYADTFNWTVGVTADPGNIAAGMAQLPDIPIDPNWTVTLYNGSDAFEGVVMTVAEG